MDEEQFYAGDDFADEAAFYDGPTGDGGKPYDAVTVPIEVTIGTPPDWLPAEAIAFHLAPEPAPPALEPVWEKPLLTAEEFMAKYNLTPPTPEAT